MHMSDEMPGSRAYEVANPEPSGKRKRVLDEVLLLPYSNIDVAWELEVSSRVEMAIFASPILE